MKREASPQSKSHQGQNLADLGKLVQAREREQAKARLEAKRLEAERVASQKAADAKSPNNKRRFGDLFTPVNPGPFALTDSDKTLFRKTVGEVVPVARPARKRKPPKPPAYPRQRIADEAIALADSRAAVNPSPMNWDLGLDIEDDQSFLQGGANPDLLRKLRRGLWRLQGELDLHHHTQDEAHEALSQFLAIAKTREWRCVRIIHGQGHGSFRREPVLRQKVRRWLQLRSDVLCYCEPPQVGGGSGAVLVLLGH